MPLNPWALTTIDVLKQDAQVADDASEKHSLLERMVNEATDEIETFLQRRVVYRGTPYVEFHSIREGRAELWTAEHPIVSVSAVNEDYSAQYLVATDLPTSDYIVHKERGKLTRIGGGGTYPRDWAIGVRVVRVTYVAGYERLFGTPFGAGFVAVPGAIQHVCRELVLLAYREHERKAQGTRSIADGAGGITRFGDVVLTEAMQDKLRPHVRTLYNPTHEAA